MATVSRNEPGNAPVVLLVEDEVLVRMTVATMLEVGGFGVVPVASAEEALEVLAAGPEIRALVTDVSLRGGMNGLDLARQAREEWGIGAVVLSGRVSPEGANLPPGVHFLAKPVHRNT